jgi:hypothetical protein
MSFQRLVRLCSIGIVAGLCGLASSPLWAQKKKQPPPVSSAGPTLAPILSSLQPGQAADIVLTGTNLANPTGVALNFPAKATIAKDDKDSLDAAKCKVRIEVPKDTPVGWYALRYATPKGVSNLRVICVDDLPAITSTNNNRSRTTAQAIAVPSVVSGAVIAEQGDVYKFTVKAGQRLSFDCQARRIGSAIDAQMSVYDAKSQRQLAYDNDSPGCQTDPRITFTFKEAGEYLLEVNDVLNRGGGDYFYRIRVGDFPLASTPIPMAVKRGTSAKISFAGPAVDGVAAVEIKAPADPSARVMLVAPKSPAGLHGWPVPVVISDDAETAEQEPNNDPKKGNRIVVPGGVTGRFQQSDDLDCYVFSAKKGQKLAIEAQTLELNSPSLVYMVLKNAKTNAEVAKSNPAAPPPGDQRFEYTPTDDGDFVLEVQHLHFAGGPSESYRVTIRPPMTGFELNLPSDRYEVAPTGMAAIPVQVVRKGYTGPIELSASGLTGLSGSATIKAGQNAGVLMVAAKSDVAMGAYQFQIVGKATVAGQGVQQIASAKGPVAQALNGVRYPPMPLESYIALAVKEKAPFSLAIKMDPPQGIPGGKAQVTITATRDAGFNEEITLTAPTGLPATIPAPKLAAIAKGKNEISFALDVNAKTPMGEYFVMVGAKAKHMGNDYSAAAPPLMLVVGLPFELTSDAPMVSLKPGEKTKLKITAMRKGGYKGPIALEVRKLPAGVTAGKATLAADQTTVEIELSAAPTAAPGDAAFDVAGTATGLNNLLNASPTIMVRVQKK